MSSQPESGFRILNIVVLESHFKREVVINFQPQLVNNFDLSVHSDKHEPTNQFSISVKGILKGLQGDRTEFSIEVTIVGVFEKFGEPPYSDEQFITVNGPAIIFPFIREHIASTALKGGIGNILLPPVNFTQN